MDNNSRSDEDGNGCYAGGLSSTTFTHRAHCPLSISQQHQLQHQHSTLGVESVEGQSSSFHEKDPVRVTLELKMKTGILEDL